MIRIPRLERIIGLGIFAASASLFILLRSHQYLAVDGALRCLSVYWLGRPTAGGNNHLLYFVNVFVWAKALWLLGLNPTNAFDFVRLTHWMNALAAAGSISMFWLLCDRATASKGAALGATCAYAFSNAFLLHATSTAEPMIGLFWSFASISMVASSLAKSSRFRVFVGGVLLLLAMATYESMVLIGPAELLLIYNWKDSRKSPNRKLTQWFLAGCAFGGISTYAPIYALSGTTAPVAMWHRFLDMGGGEQVYGGLTASKLLNLPIGFANSILSTLPVHYEGIRWFFRTHSHDRWILLSSTSVLLLWGCLVWSSIRLASLWGELERRQRLILKCCAVALAFDVFPLIFWDPLYDKLWLQPLAVVLFAYAMTLAAWHRLRAQRMFVLEASLVGFVLISGLAGAFEASLSSTPCLSAARNLAGSLRASDLLVTEWDPISLLYSSFWGNGAKTFDVPTTASGNGPETLSLLDADLSRASSSGGRVYFIGVLDMPESDWKPYLENKCHLPYHSLDRMRQCAKPVATFTCIENDEVLWQLSPGCYKP